MDKELPENWVKVHLKEITIRVEKIDPSKEPNKQIKYIDISSINSDNNTIEDPKTLWGKEAPSRARQVVFENDVIISTVRPYLKRIAKVDVTLHRQIASTGFAVIRLVKSIDPSYVFYNAVSDKFIDNLTQLQRGASYPAVRNVDVLAQSIPLPPPRAKAHCRQVG
ncbi:MAG: restriction endonuclease subunit S [Saprospiraceae bacterium]|nr:restriction endonuclease subunit S [Saprospiraceae bacterium]